MAAGRYRRLLPYAARRWPTLLLIFGLTAAYSVVTALQPWPMKLLVDYALGDVAVPARLGSVLQSLGMSATPATLVIAAGLASLGLFLLNSALDLGLGLAWAAAGQRMVYDLAADLFHRLQRLSLLFHSRRHVGDSLNRLMGDTWCVYTVTEGVLISPGRHILALFTIGMVAWTLDPVLTVFSLAITPVLVGSSIFFGRRLKRRSQLGQEAHSRLLSFVHQTLTAVPIVQAFGAEERNRKQFRKLAADSVGLSQQGTLLGSAHGLVNGLITILGTAAVLYVGGVRVLSGTLSVGSLLVLLAYLGSMQGALHGLFGTYTSLKTAEANADRVFEVLDAEDGVRDAPGARVLPSPVRGHVRLEAVSFGYEPDQPVLQNVSLEARPGETVALVGATGAGKSTLASLIPRFFDPLEGRITFDGTDIREVQLGSLRAQISLVLQEPFLLPLSVADNIAYGRPEASRPEIIAAAEAARANEFIRRLPQGYDTVIGERGATLSGGQRQRLAIARALLKDAPVLILDEPTSALDARTEALLLDALERLMAGRTTFVIAHRLSTIRRADRIAVLEEGRIVEIGSHSELLAQGGAYYHFWQAQFATSTTGAAA